jgi:hypothetical protein
MVSREEKSFRPGLVGEAAGFCKTHKKPRTEGKKNRVRKPG